MRYPYKSAFYIGDEQKKEIENAKNKFKFFNPISFCYMSDETVIKKQGELMEKLKIEYEKLKKNEDTFREMISHQLANHEACITCDYRDALESLGLKFSSLTENQKKIVKEELNKQIQAYC